MQNRCGVFEFAVLADGRRLAIALRGRSLNAERRDRARGEQGAELLSKFDQQREVFDIAAGERVFDHGDRDRASRRRLYSAIHLDALIRSGWNDAAVKILQADERERPTVPSTKRALADLYRKLGRAEQAMTADYQAEQLARQHRTAA